MSNESIQNLLESSKHLDFDIIIKVGENPNIKEFKAHSIILSARSSYFKIALSSRWIKRENEIITFNKPNISPPVFETLINYIYTGTFSNPNEVSFLDIFIAADEIQLFEISQKAEKRLLDTVSAWKFPKDFITICKHNIFTNLYQSALKFVRNEAYEYLRQGKFFQALELYEEILNNGHHSAEDQKSASTWDLSGYRCGLKNLDELTNVLCKNRTLTSLNLSINNIGKGGKILADALCKNTMLTFLDLSSNRLGSEEGKELAGALSKNTTLTCLNLSSNKLVAKGGKALADALCENTTLTSLNLSLNQLGSGRKTLKALVDALCKNTTLISLNLWNNQLGLEGAKALANVLCKNNTLKDLNLRCNNFGLGGGKAVAYALCENNTLENLNLRNNKLGSEGGRALANALCENITLTSLDIKDNNINFKLKSINPSITIIQ